MYEKFFRLRERPFALSPDPEYLYPSRVHQEALSYLRVGIEGHAGFVVLTGEIGSGKTTMLQSLVARLDRRTTVARLVNTTLDPRELLETIALELGVDPTGLSKPVLLHRLADFLVQQRQAGRLTLLAIDEAQNLSLAALEEVRLLSNLETEKSKLIQIVLLGQPELRDKLASPSLRQLRQRVTVSYHLQPLDADDTAKYVNHRLKRAAIGAPLELPSEVTQLIYERSEGVPRLVNVIADALLLFAYGIDQREIDLAVAQEALLELDATGVLASYREEGEPALAGAPAITASDDVLHLAAAVHTRELALTQRERLIAQREQTLTAQQRVLEEEARLLASARAVQGVRVARASQPAWGTARQNPPGRATLQYAASRADGTSAATATHAPATGVADESPHTAMHTRTQRYERTVSEESGGIWHRVRRSLFGVTEL